MNFAKSIVAIAGAAAFGLAASPASAAVTTYTNYADWAAAVTGITNTTLPDVDDYLSLGTGEVSAIFDGVTYTQDGSISNDSAFLLGSNFTNHFPALSSQGDDAGLSNFRITLPFLVKAIAFNYGGFDGANVGVVFGAESLTASGVADFYDTTGFFGVTSDDAFGSVQLATSDSVFNIANVSYGAEATGGVPEPATWGLMLLGFGGLGVAIRRRRRYALA